MLFGLLSLFAYTFSDHLNSDGNTLRKMGPLTSIIYLENNSQTYLHVNPTEAFFFNKIPFSLIYLSLHQVDKKPTGSLLKETAFADTKLRLS